MGRVGKKEGEELRGRFYGLKHFQVDALCCIPSDDPQKRSECLDRLAVLADELAHIPITHGDRQQNPQIIDSGIYLQLVTILNEGFKNVLEKGIPGEFRRLLRACHDAVQYTDLSSAGQTKLPAGHPECRRRSDETHHPCEQSVESRPRLRKV